MSKLKQSDSWFLTVTTEHVIDLIKRILVVLHVVRYSKLLLALSLFELTSCPFLLPPLYVTTPSLLLSLFHSPLLVSSSGSTAAPEPSSSCLSSSPCRRTCPSPWRWPRSPSLHTVSSGTHESVKTRSCSEVKAVNQNIMTLCLPWACCRRGSPAVASARWWRQRALWRRRRPVPSSSWSSWPRCRRSDRTERRARRANASALQEEEEKKTDQHKVWDVTSDCTYTTLHRWDDQHMTSAQMSE